MNHSTIFTDHSASTDPNEQSDPTVEAFRWLLIYGFPASVAAARLMPELFSDAIGDSVELARRLTQNPFGRTK